MEKPNVFSVESILIVTNKGVLKRLKTPFKALLLVAIDELKEDEIYLVTAVIIDQNKVMMYGVRGQNYYYYCFIIIG